MTHEYGRHNTNSIGCRNICIVHRQLSVEILYGLQGNYRSDEKMNIFVLDDDPIIAAQMMDCVRVPKMVTETAQMMASALRRHGATDEMFIGLGILTKAGKPYKGGYAHHPCTIWAGDTHPNFSWLAIHGIGLISEYRKRFGKEHACAKPIIRMEGLGRVLILKPSDDILEHITGGVRTPFAQAMPDEYKDDDAVKAYRAYYHSKADSKGGVHYRHTSPPYWWLGVSA
tara:strand:- start:5614 stop:6297 length:684 start_codon:yes stop_codon:yes gene_type:complete